MRVGGFGGNEKNNRGAAGAGGVGRGAGGDASAAASAAATGGVVVPRVHQRSGRPARDAGGDISAALRRLCVGGIAHVARRKWLLGGVDFAFDAPDVSTDFTHGLAGAEIAGWETH